MLMLLCKVRAGRVQILVNICIVNLLSKLGEAKRINHPKHMRDRVNNVSCKYIEYYEGKEKERRIMPVFRAKKAIGADAR
jgi:hypothetical protein